VTFAHIVLETFVFGTIKLNRASIGPYVISSASARSFTSSS